MAIKKLFLGIVFIFLIGIVCAQSISVNLDKTMFNSGDEIPVSIVLENTGNNAESFVVDLEIYHEENLYSFETISQEVILKASEKKTLEYSFSIKRSAIPGNYIVKGTLWKGTDKLDSEIKKIEISGTDKVLDLVLESYNAKKAKTNVFVKGEMVYLDYGSEISSVDIDAILVYPDGTEKKVSLPASIETVQTGTYELMIVASKTGYETITRKINFAVVDEKETKISSVSVCNSNNVCDNNENYKICPQDCKPNIITRYSNCLIIILVIIALVLIYVLKKGKKKVPKRKKRK